MAWLLTWLVHGMAIALIARALLHTLQGLSAATRYAIWWAALVLVLLVPVMRWLPAVPDVPLGATGDATPAAPAVAASQLARQPAEGPPARLTVPVRLTAPPPPSIALPIAVPADTATAAAPLGAILAGRLPLSLPVPPMPDWMISAAIGAWIGCAMLGLAQIAYSVSAIRRLKGSCSRVLAPAAAQLPLWRAARRRGRHAHLKTSDRVRTAVVLGLVRPIIALPRDLSASLTPGEVDQVILHEYAHVQRYDDWSRLVQVVIAAFVGWHPAVRMLLRQIDFEREASCDDWVVETTGAPRAYARCLTKIAERGPGGSMPTALPCAHSSTGHTLSRIERLLEGSRPSGRLAFGPALAAAMTLAMLAVGPVRAVPVAFDVPHARHARSHDGAAASIAAASAVPDSAGTDSAGAESPVFGSTTFGSAALGLAAFGPAGAGLTAFGSAGSGPTASSGLVGTGPATLASMTSASGAASSIASATAAPADDAGGPLRIAAASMLPLSLPLPQSLLHLSMANLSHPFLGFAASNATRAMPGGVDDLGAGPRDSSGDRGGSQNSATGANTPVIDTPLVSTPVSTPVVSTTGARRASSSQRSPTLDRTNAVRRAAKEGSGSGSHPFAVGPVAAAGDANALTAAADAGPIQRAWDSALDATALGVTVGARATGSATKTATTKAAAGVNTGVKTAASSVKTSSVKAVRFLGRVGRSISRF